MRLQKKIKAWDGNWKKNRKHHSVSSGMHNVRQNSSQSLDYSRYHYQTLIGFKMHIRTHLYLKARYTYYKLNNVQIHMVNIIRSNNNCWRRYRYMLKHNNRYISAQVVWKVNS